MFANWSWRKWFISLVAKLEAQGLVEAMFPATWHTPKGRELRRGVAVWLLSCPRLSCPWDPVLLSFINAPGHSSFGLPSLG